MINVGDKFIGTVNGMKFEVIEFRSARKDVGLQPDYILRYGTNDKVISATQNLLDWLLKSGGLIND